MGAGPTGLAAALFLAERGVRCRIIDAAPAPSSTSRAQVINPRTLELLESSGVSAAILAEARPIHHVVFYEGWTPLTQLEFGTAHPRYRMSVLPQARTEALLAGSLDALGVQVERPAELIWLSQSREVVTATIKVDSRVESVQVPLALGADGAHSRIREELGIEFAGSSFPESWPLFDIELNDPLALDAAHVSFVADGLVFLLAIRPGLWRVFGNVPDLLGRLPPRTRIGEVQWESSFHIAHRVAAQEALGRVALAGDAAHIHSPVAARGMNLGIEDAFVFAECATQALGGNPASIAEYGRARHEVHKHVVARIARLTRLARGQPHLIGLGRRLLMPEITRVAPTQRAMVGLVTGLDHGVRGLPAARRA